MKLTVLIRRQQPGEIGPGRLLACVLQGSLRGEQLLKRRVTDIDTATQAVDKLLMAEYKLIDPPEIEYIIEDPKSGIQAT